MRGLGVRLRELSDLFAVLAFSVVVFAALCGL